MSAFWEPLRRATPARIGLGRAGNAVPTSEVLAFGAAHAAARDAVHLPLDVDALVEALGGLGLGTPLVVASAAPDRATYLTRPDLGRVPGADLELGQDAADLALVVADGLSAEAVAQHAVPLLEHLLPLLDSTMTVAAPVVATQARVALGDHIGQALGARLVLVLIGERPGLSSSDSLGAYLTWDPRPGVLDSARNCVSNIRPPHGLDHATAARTIVSLVAGARELGATGVALKDGSFTGLLPDATTAATHDS
ncbi:ethanolamine ammonia-lyase subunit EutC [Nocardioides luteus]|uniref:Ethanolamine ammonia-lyase small subunit n=1 Tax=Nocardioides luteus TaxID=1844 RepID=A0A1J4N420_9ACTN|nr:ethanolamine ammonia-lyase subunit EutC [Nocardioides luteus]OIJ25695.1 ethanolamine ammonia-lyase [Nocardioides luteus]